MGDFKVHQVRFFDYMPASVQCMAYSSALNKLAISRNVRPEIVEEDREISTMEELAAGSIEIWSIDDNWFQEQVFPPVSSVEALVWCGERLFSGGMDEFVHEHDLETGKIKCSAASNNHAIWCMTMDKEQLYVAAGTEGGCIVLFEVNADGIEYYRAFSNLGERILSIVWHDAENVIVTGGVDSIRVWSVHSRQPIGRIDTGRITPNVQTFVYTLGVTSDFTIVSGDSRGFTSFWDGRHCTLIKSFRAHQGPVFALCLTDGGRKVLTSGADPTMIQFEEVQTTAVSQTSAINDADSGIASNKSTWVMSTMRTKHSHDVRSLVSTGKHVVSAGVDGRLVVFSVADGRTIASAPVATSPVPQRPVVQTAIDANAILLQYARRLELWKLGSTHEQPATDKFDSAAPAVRSTAGLGATLNLSAQPSCIVSVVLREGHFVQCSAVSPAADWIVYSDQSSLRLFHLAASEQEDDAKANAPTTVLTRVRCLPGGGAIPANCLHFTPDSSRLIIAPRKATGVQVWNLDILQPLLIKVLEPPLCAGGPQPVLSLTVNSSGRFLATCDVHRHIHVYQLKKHKYVCTLPTRSCHPTDIAFHPTEPVVLAAYADKMLLEFNISQLEYTSWSQQFSEHVPLSWIRRHNTLRHVFYHPRQPQLVFAADDEMFCVIDKMQAWPEKSVKLFRNPYATSSTTKSSSQKKHALHICEHFKYLLHFDMLNDDSLIVVEQPPESILQSLPPPLRRKHFGV